MAGVGGSSGRQARPSSAYGSRHSETVSMTGGPGFGSIVRAPYVPKTVQNRKNAMSRFTVGPPAITMTFFHQAIL